MTTTSTGLPQRIHAVGIGGGGLGPLARMLAELGHDVRGSDGSPTFDPEPLRKAGIHVECGHAAAHVGDAQLLIRSAAVPDTNPEVEQARRHDVPVLKYAEALGRLTTQRATVAVAGTHGKTTTSSLVAHLLAGVGVDPGWIIGGAPRSLASAATWGEAAAPFIVEACEYDHSFLNLTPRWAIITGVVADHLDCFGDEAGVRKAFALFAARVAPDGVLVVGRDVPDDVLASARCRVLRVGADVRLEEVSEDASGYRGLVRRGAETAPFRFDPMGAHNLENLTAALAVATCAAPAVALADLAATAASFRGAARRLHDHGEILLSGNRRVRLIDDFAHHPDALNAARRGLATRFDGRRVVAVFQPHQVSRTRDFFDDFARSLAAFERVHLCDIFVTRDTEPERAEPLVDALAQSAGKRCTRCGDARDASLEHTILEQLEHDDVVVVMGAGSIDGLADRIERAARP